MTVSRTELIGIVAILLYIVFFSHSPPYALRSALRNVYIAGTLFAALTYVTLRINQSIGVLLIIAFILTMTRVTEQFTEGMTMEEANNERLRVIAQQQAAEQAAAKEWTKNFSALQEASPKMREERALAEAAKGTPTTTGVTAGATTAAAPAQATPPVVAAPATVAAPTAPAVPGVTATPPAPVMSCNIESFAPF